ncbi:MAG: phytanoyl-CoA dioxygenase family protein [Planctomycetes bacterium]|nr:phytanoyl-CoA dioxygenase family protein [Planctomycetota bacterium]
MFSPCIVECDWQDVAQYGLDAQQLSNAQKALHDDGFIIIRYAVDPDHFSILKEKMYADLEIILQAKDDLPQQFVAQHLQQNPPPMPPYLFRDIMCNEAVIDVCASFLGPQMKNVFYSGNTNLPGSTDQPVHSDGFLLWPNLEEAYPASAFMVNMPMADCDAQSGSIELWPGSHLSVDKRLAQEGSIVIAEDLKAEQAAQRPPLQPSIQAGDFLIRDERLWHCGKAHHGDKARPMIAQIYASGFRQWDGLQLHEDAEQLLKHDRLQQNAEYFSGDFDYLFNNHAYIDNG